VTRRPYITPGGIRVCGTDREPTPQLLAAVDELAAAAIRAEETRRAALSPEQRAAEDTRRAEGAARLSRIRHRARGD
jgi:hypothetical protein